MKQLFNFYDHCVEFESNSQVLLDRIRNDFSYFSESEISTSSFQRINAHLGDMSNIELNGRIIWNRKNTKTYQDQTYRYTVYDNRLISKYDFTTESGELAGDDLDLLHEVTYLLILSRIGKSLDIQGFHRLHAMATYTQSCSYICIGPSGAGKSTLCLNLLKNGHYLISDDTPLLTANGSLKKFPIRIGLKDKEILKKFNVSNFSILKRLEYGEKVLVSSDEYVSNQPTSDYYKVFLMKSSSKNTIERSSFFQIIQYNFLYLVIGVGTPVIFEYFWETGPKDFYTKTKIFLKRCICAFNFIRKNDFFTIYSDNEQSAKELLSELSS